MASLRNRSEGSFGGRNPPGDRATALTEDIWREKIVVAVTGEATRLPRSLKLILAYTEKPLRYFLAESSPPLGFNREL